MQPSLFIYTVCLKGHFGFISNWCIYPFIWILWILDHAKFSLLTLV